MTDDVRRSPGEAPIEGAPTWVRALQAALIGIIAGLALHALLSLVVLHGETPEGKHPGPAQCKKAAPARESSSPRVSPRISGSARYVGYQRTL